jgi:pimeloyl-ACP methyl ester carboxylesterase
MKLSVNGESTYCYTNSRAMDASLDTVVFVHGAGLDHSVWTLASRHFARHGFNVISPDLPGHGRSEGAPLTSIEACADWVLQLLDAHGIERAALVGHSMGSLVALECAASYPQRARSLALVNSIAPMPVAPAILDASAANDHVAFDMLTQWGYSKRHQYGGNSNPGMWMLGGTLRLFERSGPGVLNADMNACNDYQTGLESAAKVTCPVLMILGREDRLTPVRGTVPLQDAFAKVSVRIIENAGHTLMVEAPNDLLDALHEVV